MEFIPAKDLPVLEAESPDVLAVDPATGAMGRVPGANLGGGAYIIDVTDLWDGSSSEVTIDDISYDDFAEHWYNGGALVFRGTPAGGVMTFAPIVCIYSEGRMQIVCMVLGGAVTFYFTNGTWTPPAE